MTNTTNPSPICFYKQSFELGPFLKIVLATAFFIIQNYVPAEHLSAMGNSVKLIFFIHLFIYLFIYLF